MKNKLYIISFLLVLINVVYPSSCEFIVDDISSFKKDLGTIIINKSSTDTLWIARNSPVSLRDINSDYMYVLINNNTVNYLRFSALNDAIQTGNSIKINHISWAFPEVPMQNRYLMKAYKNNRKPQFTQTIDTIGDSITWAGYGRYLRCLMRDNGLMFDFVGSHTDTFGFGNDGEGGNTSTQVLKRIKKITSADAYFLLIGTNDWMEKLSPQKTIDNIKAIAMELSNKNANATIFISTILPVNNPYNSTIDMVNKLILHSENICNNCRIIDIGSEFTKIPNWKNYLIDTVHPNLEGYKILSKIITDSIQKY